MSPERFQHLLDLVRPHIEKEDTKFRKAISAAQRMAITLRLATNTKFFIQSWKSHNK